MEIGWLSFIVINTRENGSILDYQIHLIPPQTIAMLYALLGDLIIYFVTRLVKYKLINSEDAKKMWASALEKNTVKRRFTPPEKLLEEHLKQSDDIT